MSEEFPLESLFWGGASQETATTDDPEGLSNGNHKKILQLYEICYN